MRRFTRYREASASLSGMPASSETSKPDTFGVSCWHEGPAGSAALWQLYTARGLGVAVKSTPARVQPLWVAD